MREPPGPCGAGRLRVACCPLVFRAPSGPAAREIATREPAARSGRSRSPPWPSGPSGTLHTGGACGAVCVVAHRLVVRPGPADPAAPSDRWLVVCVLPGQALCGLCGACTEREEARDCCRQYERTDAHIHERAGCLSDEESLKQPGEQEETEEAPHASRCACHQLL